MSKNLFKILYDFWVGALNIKNGPFLSKQLQGLTSQVIELTFILTLIFTFLSQGMALKGPLSQMTMIPGLNFRMVVNFSKIPHVQVVLL
jgi:hypothetical protein